MFGPITVPFGSKMLFNTVTLKPEITFDDVELAFGELCSVVKDVYGGDVAAPVFSQVMAGSLRTLGVAQDAPPKPLVLTSAAPVREEM